VPTEEEEGCRETLVRN